MRSGPFTHIKLHYFVLSAQRFICLITNIFILSIRYAHKGSGMPSLAKCPFLIQSSHCWDHVQSSMSKILRTCRYGNFADMLILVIADMPTLPIFSRFRFTEKRFANSRYWKKVLICRYCRCRYKYRHTLIKYCKTPKFWCTQFSCKFAWR